MMQSQLCLRYLLLRLNVKHFDVTVGMFWSLDVHLAKRGFQTTLKKERNNQKERKERKKQTQSSDINISPRSSNHANLVQPYLTRNQLGLAQIIGFNTHMERYNDTGIAHFWYAAAITK